MISAALKKQRIVLLWLGQELSKLVAIAVAGSQSCFLQGVV